jgi:hypothetical protein
MQQLDTLLTLTDDQLDAVVGGVMDNPSQDYSNWQHSVIVGAWSPFGIPEATTNPMGPPASSQPH